MSFIEKRNEIRPTSGEAPFSLDEVFFSRTDERGVILAGNYVFHRVAAFEWSEMLGAPHKIIRHPDMPKAVFWLLWHKLKQGRPVGAYVKNRAKDGLYYWVFAAAVPCPGGYLSARIKPTSPLFATIRKEYEALLMAEKRDPLSPEQSAQRLLARLGELGFADYDQFSAHALSEELMARDRGLSVPVDTAIVSLREMRDAAEVLRRETETLVDEFKGMRTIPHNMRVIASRIEPTGGPVSTLSKNYGAMSHEMSSWFEHHVVGEGSDFSTIRDTVNENLFLTCMARILGDCDRQISEERRKLGDVDVDAERRLLHDLVEDYARRSETGLATVGEEARRILTSIDKMHRHVLGLSSTRVLCKIESARLPSVGDGLTDIISQLKVFQERIAERLDLIARQSALISSYLS